MESGDPVATFATILRDDGLHAALRFLNGRAPHRFTGVYRFDPPTLRSVHLVDSFSPDVRRGDDPPMAETYCAIVGATEHPFVTPDTRADQRLDGHPARDQVIAYCGVLLRDELGSPIGTLCHFDLKPCDVPVHELPTMEAAAALIAPLLHHREP